MYNKNRLFYCTINVNIIRFLFLKIIWNISNLPILKKDALKQTYFFRLPQRRPPHFCKKKIETLRIFSFSILAAEPQKITARPRITHIYFERLYLFTRARCGQVEKSLFPDFHSDVSAFPAFPCPSSKESLRRTDAKGRGKNEQKKLEKDRKRKSHFLRFSALFRTMIDIKSWSCGRLVSLQTVRVCLHTYILVI